MALSNAAQQTDGGRTERRTSDFESHTTTSQNAGHCGGEATHVQAIARACFYIPHRNEA